MRLAHPIMPFISEEIWQSIKDLAGVDGQTLMLQPYPQPDDGKIDETAEKDIDWLKGVIVGVRNIRGEMNISPAKELSVLFQDGSGEDLQRLNENRNFLIKLAKLEDIQWLEAGDEAPMSATQLVGSMKVLVPMAGLIDVDTEKARLNKEIDKAEKDFARINGKLSNASFVAKAPEAVVSAEKAKAVELEQKVASLKDQISKLDQL